MSCNYIRMNCNLKEIFKCCPVGLKEHVGLDIGFFSSPLLYIGTGEKKVVA